MHTQKGQATTIVVIILAILILNEDVKGQSAVAPIEDGKIIKEFFNTR